MTQPYPGAPGPPPYGPGQQPPPAAWPSYGYPQSANPPPAAGYAAPMQIFPAPVRRLPRPPGVTMAAVMTVTASLQFVCTLSFLWLIVVSGMSSLPTADLGADSALYHLLRRFHLAMIEGLAWPLYLTAVASFVLGFLLLVPRSWTRWAYTALGVVALAWSAVWLHREFVYWIPAALYILVACLLVWTPAATAWYRARGRVEI